MKSRVIDNTIGHVFDVQFDDINNDGKIDLLVTSNGLSNTGVYVYEIPADFRYLSHQLSNKRCFLSCKKDALYEDINRSRGSTEHQ